MNIWEHWSFKEKVREHVKPYDIIYFRATGNAYFSNKSNVSLGLGLKLMVAGRFEIVGWEIPLVYIMVLLLKLGDVQVFDL